MSRRSQRAQSAWNVPTDRPLASWPPTSASSRSRSSRAALVVKGTAGMLYGKTFCASSKYATRWTITRVLPEPGPARISSGPSTCETASRWNAFSPARWCSARPALALVVVMPAVEHAFSHAAARAGPNSHGGVYRTVTELLSAGGDGEEDLARGEENLACRGYGPLTRGRATAHLHDFPMVSLPTRVAPRRTVNVTAGACPPAARGGASPALGGAGESSTPPPF